MFDIETFDISNNSALDEIGCVVFDSDFNIKNKCSIKFNSSGQDGRSCSLSNRAWRLKNGLNLSFSVDSNSVSLDSGMDIFSSFISSNNISTFWSYGYFDIAILNGIRENIIPYRKHRDLRTLTSFLVRYLKLKNNHIAINDCENQIELLKFCLSEMEVSLE